MPPILVHHRAARAFLSAAGDLLDRTEDENNLLVGVAHELARDPARYPDRNTLITVHEPSGSCVAAFLRTPPWGALITDAGLESVEALVADARRQMPDLHEILGPRPAARAFARAWSAAVGGQPVVLLEMRAYRLDAVIDPPTVPGALRGAGTRDLGLLERWVLAFHDEVGLPLHDAPADTARRFVAEGRTWIWDVAGRPATLVCGQGETPRGARISMVYTPPDLRGRGHASAAVAEACRRALAEGKRMCLLFADVANPTSNAIYQRIGFREVSLFSHILLGSPTARTPDERGQAPRAARARA